MPEPKRWRIGITSRAADDLVGICTYIQQDSPQNASAVAQKILDAIDSLSLFPNRYKVHQHRSDPARTVHSMPVTPVVVYYRVVAGSDLVEVIAVRHGHQRQPKQFR